MKTNLCKCGGNPLVITNVDGDSFICRVECDKCGETAQSFFGDIAKNRLVMKRAVSEWNETLGENLQPNRPARTIETEAI